MTHTKKKFIVIVKKIYSRCDINNKISGMIDSTGWAVYCISSSSINNFLFFYAFFVNVYKKAVV